MFSIFANFFYPNKVVMEFCGGGSLLEIIELFPKLILKESHVAYIVREVDSPLRPPLSHSRTFSLTLLKCAQALRYIHQMNRLHRDIKSNNVLLSSSGQVKLSK